MPLSPFRPFGHRLQQTRMARSNPRHSCLQRLRLSHVSPDVIPVATRSTGCLAVKFTLAILFIIISFQGRSSNHYASRHALNNFNFRAYIYLFHLHSILCKINNNFSFHIYLLAVYNIEARLGNLGQLAALQIANGFHLSVFCFHLFGAGCFRFLETHTERCSLLTLW